MGLLEERLGLRAILTGGRVLSYGMGGTLTLAAHSHDMAGMKRFPKPQKIRVSFL